LTSKDSAEVTVKEAYLGDPGRGIARISLDIMKALNLVSGDVIEIEGRKKATAVVWPGYPEDTRKAVIRIDGTIRANAGTGIDEKVRIRKIEVVYAKKVVVQPTQPIRLVGGEQYLSRLLRGRSVQEGQAVRVDVLGNPLTFVIAKVIPKGVGVVTDDTEIELKEEAYEPGREEKRKKEVPDVHYEDIGGLGKELQLVREMIELPLRHPELFERLGIEPPKGVLLYGPPGTGKTLIAKAVANEVEAHFITLSGPEIMSKFYGESEKHLREVFDEASENAPAIIFIDELDSIAPKRAEVTGEVERRVVAQLLALMDGLKGRGQVVVIAATNMPDAIDPALRRGGRFDREIEVGIPDRKGRMEIFQIHTRGVPLDLEKVELTEEQKAKVEEDFNAKKLDLDYYREKLIAEKKREKFDRLAKPGGGSFDPQKVSLTGEEMKAVDADYTRRFEEEKRKIEEPYRKENFLREFADTTHGFVGADIALLVKEAAMFALRCVIPRIKIDEAIPAEILDKLRVRKADFDEAHKHVEPSAMREVLVEIPDVKWTDVGGLEEVKQDLREAVEWPLKYGEVYTALQTKPPKGILLFGPPGTGKTLLAKAVANESECNFISVKGPELLSKWVGESEKGVREIFRKARQAAPSIIFFDEVDALVPRRGMYMGSSHVTESVVSQILTELDGLEELKNVVVLGATNRPDMIDPALLRPGRLDRIVYVPPPDAEGRRRILEVYLGGAKTILSGEISMDDLVARTEGYVGADIEALVREAKLAAMREIVAGFPGKSEGERREAVAGVQITPGHFDQAFGRVKGSLDADTLEENERRSWEMIYNAEERKALEGALAVLKRAELASAGPEASDELVKGMEDLRAGIFARRKDWKELKKYRERLEKVLEKRHKLPDKVPLTAR
jgi:transitional endoplasmic reticulum ATPase